MGTPVNILDKILENLEKCEELDASEGGLAANGLHMYTKYWADESQYETILSWSEEMLERFLDTCVMVECDLCKKEFPETTGVDNDKFCSQKCLEKYNTFGFLNEGDVFLTKVGKYVKRDGKAFCIDNISFGTIVKFNKNNPIIRG